MSFTGHGGSSPPSDTPTRRSGWRNGCSQSVTNRSWVPARRLPAPFHRKRRHGPLPVCRESETTSWFLCPGGGLVESPTPPRASEEQYAGHQWHQGQGDTPRKHCPELLAPVLTSRGDRQPQSKAGYYGSEHQEDDGNDAHRRDQATQSGRGQGSTKPQPLGRGSVLSAPDQRALEKRTASPYFRQPWHPSAQSPDREAEGVFELLGSRLRLTPVGRAT